MGRGRADPLPPLECRLAAPPSRSFSAASPAHFLSPTDPTTKTRTRARAHIHTPKHAHTQTHFLAGLAVSLPARRSPQPGLREKRPFVIQITPSPRARAAGSGPGDPSFARTAVPPHPDPRAPPRPPPRRHQLIEGLPGPQGARPCGLPAEPRLPRPRCALRLRARPPPPPRLPSPFPSFLRSSLGPAAAAAAFPGPRGPCRPPSPQHGTIRAELAGSSIWGKRDLKGWGVPCSLGHGCEQDGK